jgi:hypothetical protein
MRIPQYLSPTSLKIWQADPYEFYRLYLADTRQPRDPQTRPMSIGSAFDAFVKSYLFERIFGKGHKDWPKYELHTIFEAQVEPHNRDWALGEGCLVFEAYKASGALADLLLDVSGAASEPRFEMTMQGAVQGRREGMSMKIGVPLLGKPDLFFVNKEGAAICHDWKVNGYCSNFPTSPMRGYKWCRDMWAHETLNTKQSRSHNQSHKEYLPLIFKGMEINGGLNLEVLNGDWADQLATYAWLLGLEVGEEFVASIDQLVGQRGAQRVAGHRTRVGSARQIYLLQQYLELWTRINSRHFFREMSEEDSIQRCIEIERNMRAAADPNRSAKDRWLDAASRN